VSHPAAGVPPAVLRLVQHLTDGVDDDPIAAELATLLATSPRFRAFADARRDKIRKKLRTAREPDARLDVRAELVAAHRFLADRRIELAYEASGSTAGGPDFSVTMRGQRTFGLEVTRLRRTPTVGALAGAILAKLRQLPPSAPNALLLAIDAADAGTFDIDAAIRVLRERAEAGDEAFFDGRGLDGSRGFRRRLLRLGTVLTWCETAEGDARAAAWVNPSARIPIPERATRACLASLRMIGDG
jgi:hypothetical protein